MALEVSRIPLDIYTQALAPAKREAQKGCGEHPFYSIMCGNQTEQGAMFSYVSLEERVPAAHPLRAIRKLVDEILVGMSKRFDGMYAENGRPSMAPERLLRALLLQMFYTIRSERCNWITTCCSAGSLGSK